jgi:hypothetical protein
MSTTPAIGFGLCPHGSSPLGFGVPDHQIPRGGSLLADPATGQQANALLIDGKSKQYVYDANGRKLGMSGLRQRVQLAIATDKGTSALVALGQELKSIKRITGDVQRRARDIVTTALSHLGSAGSGELVIVSVLVQRLRTSVIAVLVKWRDLSTGKEFEENVH